MASSTDQASATRKEKVPKLKLDEMIPVFQLLPTSELIRFVSHRGSLLGDHWSPAFKYVLGTRLPLSLRWSRPRGSDASRFELFDARGTKVADVKRPELYRFSPLCGLTQDATLARQYHRDFATFQYYEHYDVLCIKDGATLLGSLSNLTSLTLGFDSYSENRQSDLHLNREMLSNGGSQLSQIESLTLKPGWLPVESPYYMRFDILPAFIQQMSGLRALRITSEELCALVPSLMPDFGYSNASAVEVLSGLESLTILRCGTCETPARPILDFLNARCTHLCELVMLIRGELRQYLDCWRALPNLTCLGLDILGTYQNVLVFSENDAPVPSVRDLRVFCHDGTFACSASQCRTPYRFVSLSICAIMPLSSTDSAEFTCSPPMGLMREPPLFDPRRVSVLQNLFQPEWFLRLTTVAAEHYGLMAYYLVRVLSLTLQRPSCLDQLLLYVLSKFPSVTSLSLGCRSPFQLLRYASAVCSDEDVLRSLRTLKCFSHSEGGMPTNSNWADHLVAFLQNSNLPIFVDLSQVLTFSTYMAAGDFGFLLKVYGAMQKNSVGLLVLKGRVQSEAIGLLQDFLSKDLTPASGHVTAGKIVAWQQKCHGQFDLDDPLGRRNVKITGAKTSGRLVGEKFVIKIYHALETSIGIFDL